ncbi:MAG TPA: hypothetical protein VNO35_18030 [Steroidobacteraceae bacterium]|nr:hypothetical protein [Steroidobacteraceae bacterium]
MPELAPVTMATLSFNAFTRLSLNWVDAIIYAERDIAGTTPLGHSDSLARMG